MSIERRISTALITGIPEPQLAGGGSRTVHAAPCTRRRAEKVSPVAIMMAPKATTDKTMIIGSPSSANDFQTYLFLGGRTALDVGAVDQ
jgi:hypothetical protein